MHHRKGQALVEFAMVLPFLIVIVCGIIDFGRFMYTKNSLIHAARSGARAAAITSPLGVTSPAALSSSTGEPAGTIKKNLFNGIDQNSITYEVTLLDPASGTSLSGPAATGNQVCVQLTLANFESITGIFELLGMMTGPNDSNPFSTITANAAMRYE